MSIPQTAAVNGAPAPADVDALRRQIAELNARLEVKSVEDIPAFRALAELPQTPKFQETLPRDRVLAKIDEIKAKFPNTPGLFTKRKRDARKKFLGRCDDQLNALRRKERMWNKRKANCEMLKPYDDALETAEGELQVMTNLRVFFESWF